MCGEQIVKLLQPCTLANTLANTLGSVLAGAAHSFEQGLDGALFSVEHAR